MPKLRAVHDDQPVPALGGGDGGGPEDKRGRFRRVAGRRMKTILNGMRILGKMAGNASYYEFPQEDVDKMIERLQVEINSLRERLQPKTKSNEVDFEF